MKNPIYQIWVRDHNTHLVKCMVDDWIDLRFRPTVNNFAGFSFKLHQSSRNVALISRSNRIEIQRTLINPMTNAKSSQTFSYICLSRERTLDQSGVPSEYISISGLDANAYLAARLVLPPAALEAGSGKVSCAVSASKVYFQNSQTLYRGDKIVPAASPSPGVIDVGNEGVVFDSVRAHQYSVPIGSSNAVKNPSATDDTSNVTSVNTTVTRDTTESFSQPASFKGTVFGLTPSVTFATNLTPVANDIYFVCGHFKGVAGTVITGAVYDGVVTNTAFTATLTGEWDFAYGFAAVGATPSSVNLRIVMPTGGYVFMDDLELRRSESFSISRAFSLKSGKADDVMKAYVRDALIAPEDSNRIMADFAAETDTSLGPDIEWSAKNIRLLDVLKEIADASGIDFRVEVGDNGALEFKTFYPQLGADKRINNQTGNQPVIFAVERDNISEQRWWESALAYPDTAGNHIYAAGSGIGREKSIIERVNPTGELAWGRWEYYYDSRDAATPEALSESANAEIKRVSRLDTGVRFKALQSEGNIWGIHYNLGDLVTVKIYNEPGLYISDKIIAIEVWVGGTGDTEIVHPVVGSEFPRFDKRFEWSNKKTDKLNAD